VALGHRMAESRVARLCAVPLRSLAHAPTPFRAALRKLATPALVTGVLILAAAFAMSAAPEGMARLGTLPAGVIAAWILVLVATELTPVGLPRGGTMTVSSAFDYAAIVLFGPFVTAFLDLVSGVLAHGLLRPRAPHRVLFNLATCVIAAFAASAVYRTLGGPTDPFVLSARGLLAMCGLGATYFAVNTGLVSLVLGADRRLSPTRIWQLNYGWTLRHLAAYLPLAILIALVHAGGGPFAIGLVLLPLLLCRHALRLYVEMRADLIDFSTALVSVIEEVDPYTRQHSIRVSAYAERLARGLGRPEPEVESVRLAGLLHDLGKVGQPPSILQKVGRLDPDERRRIEAHPGAGADIVARVRAFRGVDCIVRHHHERPDGQGYPAGLAGDAIPLGARIVLVADAFDAMTSDRPYRAGMPAEHALAELSRHAGTQFDPAVVEVLVRLWDRGEFAVIKHSVGDQDIRQAS
jgi:putative nucleotidyltransferase with HDIG domain